MEAVAEQVLLEEVRHALSDAALAYLHPIATCIAPQLLRRSSCRCTLPIAAQPSARLRDGIRQWAIHIGMGQSFGNRHDKRVIEQTAKKASVFTGRNKRRLKKQRIARPNRHSE